MNVSVELKNIGKKFGRRRVFANVDFTFDGKKISGVSGHNGAGKSTLVKIIANLISQSEGKIIYRTGESEIPKEEIFRHIGFVAPYLFFYTEFTPIENLIFYSRIRGLQFDKTRANELLNKFNIYKRRNDYLRGFSSGMLQRMKFVFALYHNPEILILDEPTSNLDNEGKETVYAEIENLKNEKTIIIASNETADLDLCETILELENFKKKK